MTRTITELKEDVCEVGRRLYRNGYIAAMEGNVSIRVGENAVLSTPAGVCKGYLTPDMILTCDLAGNRTDGTLRVSTEISMHLAVYKARPDVKAVTHAHPPKCTGFAVAGIPLDHAVLAEVVVTLGCIPLAEYGTPSTRDLAASVEKLIRQSDGILLSNHGAITVGQDVYDAYYKMEVIEHFAEISLIARQLGRERLLPAEEVSRLITLREKVYGVKAPAAGANCPVPAEAASSEPSARAQGGPKGSPQPTVAGDSPEPFGSRGWGPRDREGENAPATSERSPGASAGVGARELMDDGGDIIQLTRKELVALISDAVRSVRGD